MSPRRIDSPDRMGGEDREPRRHAPTIYQHIHVESHQRHKRRGVVLAGGAGAGARSRRRYTLLSDPWVGEPAKVARKKLGELGKSLVAAPAGESF
jgi:hypothetical protein